ncbi:predicted protein [Uncinocarpus reesii 1704]|uniref:WAP domain-containing protein n=1 Tax=Uncinocarpus reesii (strain UAMH 1704) TaxID=336963 RepID=C4JGI2_UNCRE|nr:uncharacterized protein UREG_01173 [Uncinocarpus reesii 1704]EEP76324.1 predicted protein [Uncinocarpus reesii 1704]
MKPISILPALLMALTTTTTTAAPASASAPVPQCSASPATPTANPIRPTDTLQPVGCKARAQVCSLKMKCCPGLTCRRVMAFSFCSETKFTSPLKVSTNVST